MEWNERPILVGFDASSEAYDALSLGQLLAEVLGSKLILGFVDTPDRRPPGAAAGKHGSARKLAEEALGQAPLGSGLADEQWRMVQEEHAQNKRLLELSQQILALSKETRALAALAEVDNQQNQELLDISRHTLDLTKQVHASTAASGTRGSGRA